MGGMRMDLMQAIKECGPWDETGYKGHCEDCKHTVIFHCKSCMIQVTGCICTAKARMTPEEFENFMKQRKQITDALRYGGEA